MQDARKSIEAKMEQFKEFEKETKTKAYSKAGLAQPSKQDPESEAKYKTQCWVNKAIEQLQLQIETFEADIEAASTKKAKGKRGDNPLEHWILRHKYHIKQLERVLRLLDNDRVSVSTVDDYRDNIIYYVEANQEPEFEEDEQLYEDMIGEHTDEETWEDDNSAEDDSKNGAHAAVKKDDKKDDHKKEPEKPAKPAGSVTVPAKPAAATVAKPAAAAALSPKLAAKPAPATSAAPAPVAAKTAAPVAAPAAAKPAPAAKTPAKPAAATAPKPAPAAATKEAEAERSEETPLAEGQNHDQMLKNIVIKSAEFNRGDESTLESADASLSASFNNEENTFREDFGALEEDDEINDANDETFGDMAMPTGIGTLEELSMNTHARLGPIESMQPAAGPVGKTAPAPAPQQPVMGPDDRQSSAAGTGLGGLGSADAMAPAANRPQPTPAANPVVDRDKRSHANALRMLQASLKTLPRPHDCERPKPYVPPNPHRTPAYYPQTPHPAFNNPEIFSKFNTDTLYFIFYYQQATYQQYLAAKELKKQSWRYHKKYLTWFQRHDQPKVTTDEYEQGTYIYFDYETGWCQRIKQEFVFKYAYLEDELQI